MANSVPNDSPMVKLAEKMLDDPHGVSEETLNAFQEAFDSIYGPRACPRLEKILKNIKGTDGRVYLPEDWDG
jgi:hypothetical protein